MADIKYEVERMDQRERAKIFSSGVKEMKEKYRMLHIEVENITGKSARDLEDIAIDEDIKGNYQMADLLYQQASEAAKNSGKESYISVNVKGNVRKFVKTIVDRINILAYQQDGKLDFPASVMDLREVSGEAVDNPFSYGALYKFD